MRWRFKCPGTRRHSLGNVPKSSNVHGRLDNEYKDRNGAIESMSKTDDFGLVEHGNPQPPICFQGGISWVDRRRGVDRRQDSLKRQSVRLARAIKKNIAGKSRLNSRTTLA